MLSILKKVKKFFYLLIPIILFTGFIFFIQDNNHNSANAQTVENEIIDNTLSTIKKATAGIAEISKAMKNASELIINSNETKKGNQDKGIGTIEQLELAQEKLNQDVELESYDGINKLNMEINPPPIDFLKILKANQIPIEVEYQSVSSVVLRADEERLLLLDGTLSSFWHAIDIVKKYGYQLKEITESGIGYQGNLTRFYAFLEK
jgi:hypothetical protein